MRRWILVLALILAAQPAAANMAPPLEEYRLGATLTRTLPDRWFEGMLRRTYALPARKA